jgi:hypothetical protein
MVGKVEGLHYHIQMTACDWDHLQDSQINIDIHWR